MRIAWEVSVEHLSEYIHLRVMEEVQSNQSDFDADPVPTIQRPEHFYVFVSHSMNLFQQARELLRSRNVWVQLLIKLN